MTDLIVPGLNGSGSGHWQSWWLGSGRDAQRVEQRDWDNPRLEEGRDRLAAAIAKAPGALIVAHSLGAILTVQLAAWRSDLPIGGALLVAPADVDDTDWATSAIASFGPIPMQRLPFPAIVVASRNDPYLAFERARTFASRWRAELVDVGERGHISTADGFGPWPVGLGLAERIEGQGRMRKIA